MKATASRPHTSLAALWGGFVLIAYLAVVSSCTTQWLAHKFHYTQQLGPPWVGGLYHPLKWMEWAWRFFRSAPNTFARAEIGFATGSAFGLIAYVLAVGFGLRSVRQHAGIHGTAAFATEEEIRQSGLLPRRRWQWSKLGYVTDEPRGVFVGGYTDAKGDLHYLRHNGPEHVAVIAPTRSGKGVGLVVPTLLDWPESVVVNDQKGELWAMTAGWRQKEAGTVAIKFDPAAAEGSARFNPLQEIRIGTIHEIGDTQNVVTIIVDPDGKGMADHWAKTAHAFLTGATLHLQYKRFRAGLPPPSLADLASELANPHRKIDALYDEMLENRHLAGFQHPAPDPAFHSHVHPTVAEAARAMLDKPANERGSVLSTAMSYLTLYQDPLVAANIATSDFRISDLMDHDKRVSLYLVVRAEDKDRMRPLMRLIINQIVRILLRPELEFENGRQKPPHKHRLLLMLDEFPSYGKLEVFEEALAYIAGYGIKAYLIMQDISQLKKSYGEHESIISNCHIRVAYAPNQVGTAKWLSEYCGKTTVITEDISTSGQRFGMFMQSVSRHMRETSRDLLTTDEVARLKAPTKDDADRIVSPGDMLVFSAGHAPIFGTQSLFFLDPALVRRSQIPPPKASDVIPGRSTPPTPSSRGASPQAGPQGRLGIVRPSSGPSAFRTSTSTPGAPQGAPSNASSGKAGRELKPKTATEREPEDLTP